jgi:hypothetical protein
MEVVAVAEALRPQERNPGLLERSVAGAEVGVGEGAGLVVRSSTLSQRLDN